MQGGNPRVRLIQKQIPAQVEERLAKILMGQTGSEGTHVVKRDSAEHREKAGVAKEIQMVDSSSTTTAINSKAPIKASFGSLHGSVFLADKGYCTIPANLVHHIIHADVVIERPVSWCLSTLRFGCMLVISITLQIVGTKTLTTGSTAVGVIILLGTSVMRGSGISGPEEWQIPQWKRRKNEVRGCSARCDDIEMKL
jgi:hypothetical protein